MSSPDGRSSVLIFGIGEVGRYLLEFLARDESELDLVAADVSLSAVEAQVDNALFGATMHGRHPSITAREADLLDLDRTAELLAEVRPDVVVNCAVLQTWHVIRRLPSDVYARLSSAGLGAWLPVQLALAMKVAQAIDRSGVSCHYVNTSLSDLTNPVLGAMGIPPTIGIGNVALIEAAIRTLVGRTLGRPRTDLTVKLVAHHIHWVLWREAGYREGAPFYLKIVADGEEITSRFEPLDLMKRAILLYPSGTSFSAVSASSAIQNLKALLSPERLGTHSPGPNGLPGGYPVRLSRAGCELDLPPELTLDQAVALNLEAQTYDGVRAIDADARVHFVDRAREQMRRFGELEQRYQA